MNLKERDPRRSGNAGLGAAWTDLLSGEALELLFGLPHIRDTNSIIGFGDPVENAAWRARAAGREPHFLDHLVVLLKSRSWKFQLHSNSHSRPPSKMFVRKKTAEFNYTHARPWPQTCGLAGSGWIVVYSENGPRAAI
jgi:hypothetical protein